MKRHFRPWVPLFIGAVVVMAAAALLVVKNPQWTSVRTAAATYVGAQRCVGCHAAEEGAWRRSHHAKALAQPSATTVLGDFNEATFDYDGKLTQFHRTGDRYLVQTDGADGKLREFPAAYSIGVFPLQQYLLPSDNGALQALNVVWDARPREQGGQRWFHLHPGEHIEHDSPLHWTAPSQNWNFMCADCHSTHLEKNYDTDTGRFDTRWSDIDVACEACHGPGSAHVGWARWASIPVIGRLVGKDTRLQLRFDERARSGRLAQVLDPSAPLRFTPGPEVQACAQCHSRRSQLTNAYVPHEGYANHYKPELLSDPLYYVDGQMREEVYEYGSFQQSRMFAKGVTCSDCHDPHSAELRATGNALCLQCHNRSLDSPSHHFHAQGSAGSQCVNCHMPTHNYMVIDARRDHSIRIPRPDLSVRFGVPNACNGCHSDKSAQWAADSVAQRYGTNHRGLQQFAAQLDAIRQQSPGAEAALSDLAADLNVPDVVKATALSEAGPYLQNGVGEIIRAGLRHANPTVRLGALQALDDASDETRWAWAAPLLNDPQRSLRIEAARILGSSADLNDDQRHALGPAWSEWVAAVSANSDRAEWRSLYATALASRGELESAARELKAAIALNPHFSSAYVNLADVYRQAEQEELAEKTLSEGLAKDVRSAALHAAMGLSLVRGHRLPEAVGELQQAATLEKDNGYYGYLYAAALRSSDPDRARRFLEEVLADPNRRHDRSELYLLVQMLIDRRDQKTLGAHMAELRSLAVNDTQARSLLALIE